MAWIFLDGKLAVERGECVFVLYLFKCTKFLAGFVRWEERRREVEISGIQVTVRDSAGLLKWTNKYPGGETRKSQGSRMRFASDRQEG